MKFFAFLTIMGSIVGAIILLAAMFETSSYQAQGAQAATPAHPAVLQSLNSPHQ